MSEELEKLKCSNPDLAGELYNECYLLAEAEARKHTHPAPETLERLAKLEQIIIPVVAFVSKQMENEEWWAGFNQRASILFTRGKFWGTVIITFLATIATINGWWLWILQASLHALADKN